MDFKKSVSGFTPSDKKKISEIKIKIVDNDDGSGIIKVDEVIGRSVGASAKNYPLRLPDGNHAKFAESSTISKIKVFAENGTNVPIRDAAYLESNYGIPADKWQKVRGEEIIIENGQNVLLKYIGMKLTVKKLRLKQRGG